VDNSVSVNASTQVISSCLTNQKLAAIRNSHLSGSQAALKSLGGLARTVSYIIIVVKLQCRPFGYPKSKYHTHLPSDCSFGAIVSIVASSTNTKSFLVENQTLLGKTQQVEF